MAYLVDANDYSRGDYKYSPTDARSFSYQYAEGDTQIQIDSPMASQSTKKEQAASQPTTVSPSESTGFTGESLIPIAIILGVAYVASGALSGILGKSPTRKVKK